MTVKVSHRLLAAGALRATKSLVMAACVLVSAPVFSQDQTALIESPVNQADANQITDGGVLMADRIVVKKSERRLYLMRNGQMLKTFRVALGLNPQGHKEREGDFKTPEGSYRLVRRNPRSDFFLSMQVSYPNDRDLARAQRAGAKPGGAIMLHGWPNTPRKNPEY